MNYILHSPVFTQSDYVPYRYVMTESQHHYIVRRENLINGQWQVAPLARPFDKNEFASAVYYWQAKIDSEVKSLDICQIQYTIEYEVNTDEESA